ncbi:MAG: hypothetical protein ACM359_02965 [Bacillota bacterium]
MAHVHDGMDIPLWSFHEDGDFSLTRGRVEVDRSRYYHSSPDIADAYQRLRTLLGTDQLVWCYTRREDFKPTSIRKYEWAIKVPRSGVLRFIDGFIWARIIRAGEFIPPRSLDSQWKREALAQFPHDPSARHALVRRKKEEYWNEPEPEEGWWSRLFVEGPGEHIDALLRHPIDPAWVVSVSDAATKHP